MRVSHNAVFAGLTSLTMKVQPVNLSDEVM